jgi:hypothetical protein
MALPEPLQPIPIRSSIAMRCDPLFYRERTGSGD